MKIKSLIILLFAIGLAMPLKAQEDKLYLGMGFSKQAGAVRAGMIFDGFGGGVYVKSDWSRPFKAMSAMEGRRHRFSVMGELTYELWEFLQLTANAGYGSLGTYRVSATQDSYGVQGLVRGFEAGGIIGAYVGDALFLYVGWSRIFAKTTVKTSEFNIGFGFAF